MNVIYYCLGLFMISILLVGCKPKGENNNAAITEEKVMWSRAVKKNTEYHYLAYGNKYPKGQYMKEAEEKFEAIETGDIDIEALLARRFTGSINRSGDKQVLSLRFEVIDEKDGMLYFRAMVNLGALGRSLNGTIDLEDNIIQFIEINDGTRLMISDGKLYVREDKTIIESIDLEQYWVLD